MFDKTVYEGTSSWAGCNGPSREGLERIESAMAVRSRGGSLRNRSKTTLLLASYHASSALLQ